MSTTDFEYPDIKVTDYIDESLPKILARDDASKHGFRRVETFPNVSSDDVGMKVWLAGIGNFQLVGFEANEPQWKQITDDSRSPAYMDTLVDSYQPLSAVLTSLAKLSNVSNALPYFYGPSDIQTTKLTNYAKQILSQNDAEGVIGKLGLGSAALLNAPIDGTYIKNGTISKDKMDSNFSKSLGWSTGDVKLTLKKEADDGWIMMNDGSISSAGYYNAAGNLVKAHNASTFNLEPLYKLLYNNFSNSILHIQTSAGVETTRNTLSADWSAKKRMPLPKVFGRALAGAGAGSGLTSRTLGATTGAETVTLTAAQLANHTHSITLKLTHGRDGSNVPDARFCNGDAYSNDTRTATTTTAGSSGGNQGHNNMQPTVFLNVMVKL